MQFGIFILTPLKKSKAVYGTLQITYFQTTTLSHSVTQIPKLEEMEKPELKIQLVLTT